MARSITAGKHSQQAKVVFLFHKVIRRHRRFFQNCSSRREEALISDRHGRRPILLISTAGAALSYVLFAVGSGLENHTAALWTLLVSRVFAGICGGNITVAIDFTGAHRAPLQKMRNSAITC